MNNLWVLLLVASCQLTSFIHYAMEIETASGAQGLHKGLQETYSVTTSPFRSTHSAASTSGSDAKTDKLSAKNDEHAAANLVARPSSVVLKKGTRKGLDSFNGRVKKVLVRLKIARAPFSERFVKNQLKYTEVRVRDSGGVSAVYRRLSIHDLAAAHQEIPGLGKFYRRINKKTSRVDKANIFQEIIEAFENIPVDQITPSDCEAWLQTFADIMGVRKKQYDPDVLMEAIAQFGLLDLMTKFAHEGLESTRQYHQSCENLQQFLAARFALVKDTPDLKAEAYEIYWASEALYYDHRVDLDTDLTRYTEWLYAEEPLGTTIERLNTAKSNSDQQELINSIKARAEMSNKETSSQEKSAATILLSILGFTSPTESELCAKARSSMESAEFSAMQLKAREAISEFLSPEPGPLGADGTNFFVFRNNAQRVQKFQEIVDFPDDLIDDKNFEVVKLQVDDDSEVQYKRMKEDILVPLIKRNTFLNNLFELTCKSDTEKQDGLSTYINWLKRPSTSQMRRGNYETSIQTLALFMEVAKVEPRDDVLEEITNSGLLQIMRNFENTKDSENNYFYTSTKKLQHFLANRRLKHEKMLKISVWFKQTLESRRQTEGVLPKV